MQESGVRAAMDRTALLRANAPGYASVALANIAREFPADVWHTFRGPEDLPRRPRERTPVFYGSFDWHSCVEMHWLLVRDGVPRGGRAAPCGGRRLHGRALAGGLRGAPPRLTRGIGAPRPARLGRPDCISRAIMQFDPRTDRTVSSAGPARTILPRHRGGAPAQASQAILVPGATDALERTLVA